MLIVDALTQQVCVFIGGLRKSGRKNEKKPCHPVFEANTLLHFSLPALTYGSGNPIPSGHPLEV